MSKCLCHYASYYASIYITYHPERKSTFIISVLNLPEVLESVEAMAKKSPITGKYIGVPSIKPQNTRKIIRRHHELLKKEATLKQKLAIAANSGLVQKELEQIKGEIDSNGGIKTYQLASIAGQDSKRGGDSSKILVSWIKGTDRQPILLPDKATLLEVGSLSVNNACSIGKNLFQFIERIDLNSQHPQIKQQDFMQRPLPSGPDEMFDVISLSLVVNYVPEAMQRGSMLERTTVFLRDNGLLFLVLPSPCILNSRYFNDDLLQQVMASLGYVLERTKVAKKIFYWLFRKVNQPLKRKFPKRLINDGKMRNNFTIILE